MNQYQLLVRGTGDAMQVAIEELAAANWKLLGPVQVAVNGHVVTFVATLGKTEK